MCKDTSAVDFMHAAFRGVAESAGDTADVTLGDLY